MLSFNWKSIFFIQIKHFNSQLELETIQTSWGPYATLHYYDSYSLTLYYNFVCSPSPNTKLAMQANLIQTFFPLANFSLFTKTKPDKYRQKKLHSQNRNIGRSYNFRLITENIAQISVGEFHCNWNLQVLFLHKFCRKDPFSHSLSKIAGKVYMLTVTKKFPLSFSARTCLFVISKTLPLLSFACYHCVSSAILL